jgi:cobalt-precorrin 5A hydrolase / precorrin-3B C17-methyltransferase
VRKALELAGRAATWRWSARAMPASTPWRRWSSRCSRGWRRTIRAGAPRSSSPGISAFQAAAARAGAIIGHDFCTISLSDLLTPWPAIEARIRAAAEGDFVVAFYNPRSRNRPGPSGPRARDTAARPPAETPVIVASNLGRADEARVRPPAGRFDPSTVDMLTVVMVGASTSRRVETGDGKTWAYTPRGYEARRRAAE